ncbi:NIPSNAP family protein [Brevundimonas sp.]|uniref:NIPSNAP family protein n=1 Tax=Brevundimonas sp. TaxID=1871086 RepID=UPI00121143B4|nr:NIPSNAP family protein [Brevundimonas sp.]TAJ57487.1 MAG: NIPSNAP family protein [Brevundimonas sp.]
MTDRPRRRTVVGGAAAAGTIFPAWPPAIARPPERPDTIVSPIVELRQYTLHPGQRDVLIELFEREFVEKQESVGMTLIGQFRDLDDPDRFVWLRGFPDMEARRLALEAFYLGPVWQANRNAANQTMVDSDNVLLLRPLDESSAFTLRERGPRGASGPGAGRLMAGVHVLNGPGDPLPEQFRREGVPIMRDAGAASVAVLVTDASPNTFPRLPVREGEPVLVWLAAFADPAAADSTRDIFTQQSIQRMRLEPTARSRLHG